MDNLLLVLVGVALAISGTLDFSTNSAPLESPQSSWRSWKMIRLVVGLGIILWVCKPLYQ